MPDNNKIFTAAGVDAVHLSVRVPGGAPGGYAGLTAASTPDTGSGWRKMLGVQAFPANIPEPNDVSIGGDDGKIDSFQFENADPNKALITFGAQDDTAADAMEGTTSKTVGVYDFFARGGSIVNPGRFMWHLTRLAHSKDSGSLDDPGFDNEIWLNSLCKPLMTDGRQSQTGATSRISALFDDSIVAFWGALTSVEFAAGKRTVITWRSENRCAVHTWISDGTEVETTPLVYTPISVATTKAWDFTANAALTVSSINAGAKTVTLSAAPLTNHLIVVLYQTLVYG